MGVRLWSVLLACGACTADRALLEIPVTIAPSADTVTTDDGVALTLTTASYTLSDLRFEYPADTTASVMRLLSPTPVAHAHPGHDFAGGVGGELLGTWTVDLLAGPIDLGAASVYDGAFGTGRLTLPEGGVVRLQGAASTADGARAFAFEVAPDAAVTGIPFQVTLDAEHPPRAIVLSVDVGHALSFVDWSTPDEDADGVLTTADGLLTNTVSFGVVATPSFTLQLEE